MPLAAIRATRIATCSRAAPAAARRPSFGAGTDREASPREEVSTMRFFPRAALATLAALVPPALAAAQNDLRPVDPQRNPPSLSERAKGAEASIPLAIQRSIEADRELSAYDIKVAGNERRGVTLSGTVPSARLRDRAERLAENASGAQHVHNDIVVTAHPTTRRGDDAATTDNSDPARVMPERE
jgi:hypothetical protein